MSYTNFKNLNRESYRGKEKTSNRHGPMRGNSNKPRYSPYSSSSSKQNQQQKSSGPVPTVFVGNLAPDITEDILVDIFNDCGDMKDVRLKRHTDTGKVKGFGFIDFYQMSCAYKAIETKNGVVVLGRPLQVELSNSRQQDKNVDQQRSNIKQTIESQPQPTSSPKQPELTSQTLSLLNHFQTTQPLLNTNMHMPMYQPTNPTSLPFNSPPTSHFPQQTNRTDTDYVSKRSNDRVEQPQRERPHGCMTVFIGNLLNDVKKEDIRDVFRGCNIKEVRWLYDSKSGTKMFKGCGFVDFEDEESTIKAAHLNGCLVLGRPMRVDYASDSKKSSKDDRHQPQPQSYVSSYRSQSQPSQTHTSQPYPNQIYSGTYLQSSLAQQYMPTSSQMSQPHLPSTQQLIPQSSIPNGQLISQQSIQPQQPISSQQNLSQSYIPQPYYP